MLRTNEHQITPPCIENSINLQQVSFQDSFQLMDNSLDGEIQSNLELNRRPAALQQ